MSDDELELASRILKRAISASRKAGPRELENMIECFNRQMDAVIDSANRSETLDTRSARRAALARDLDQAGLVLVDRDMLAELIVRAAEADDGEDLGAELLDGEPWDGKIRPGAVCVADPGEYGPLPGHLWIDEAGDIPEHVLAELGGAAAGGSVTFSVDAQPYSGPYVDGEGVSYAGPTGDYSNPNVND